LDLCSLTDTLISDADGLYHPLDYNDRLVLGLKRDHERGRAARVADAARCRAAA
jgi:hypothetical protein